MCKIIDVAVYEWVQGVFSQTFSLRVHIQILLLLCLLDLFSSFSQVLL
jgi:hypothetical protein